MPDTNASTIVELFANRIAATGDLPALWTKSDQWQSRTWNEVGQDVLRAASWLVNQGIRPGDRVAQLSENRYEWLLADLAMHVAGAVHVPIHAPLTGEQAAFQIRDSGSRIVLLSTPEQVGKLATAAAALPSDVSYYSYDSCSTSIGDAPCNSFWESLPANDEVPADMLLADAVKRTTSETLATILYTSGTTGEPKGVMLSNHNLVTNALASIAPFAQGPDDVRLTFLPLSHIFARTCDLYTWVAAGAQLALAQSRESVLADCAEIRPTLLNGVPYFFEKVTNAMQGVDFDAAPNALKDLLGGRIRLCCSGGAALPDAAFDFFTEHGVPLVQGYGLTETSPVITLAAVDRVRSGAVGQAIADVDIKIAGDGEILTRGPNIMLGYFNNDAATQEAIQDGWFHTGDIGHLDDDGYLFITGRKKELIVTSGGKNIAPVYLESLLTQDPLIAQAVVIGDARKYLSALIVVEMSALLNEFPDSEGDKLIQDPRVSELIEARIAARLSTVSRYEQIQRFALLDQPFTVESGELTPKLTLRRDVIYAKCQSMIDAMYDNH